MGEKFLGGVEEMQAGWKNNLSDSEMADGTVVVIVLLHALQDRVSKGVLRHGDTVQRADNILRSLPMMMVESLGTCHAAEREQQHPRGQLSQSCLLHGGKNTFFLHDGRCIRIWETIRYETRNQPSRLTSQI